jgi:hypothetical protein
LRPRLSEPCRGSRRCAVLSPAARLLPDPMPCPAPRPCLMMALRPLPRIAASRGALSPPHKFQPPAYCHLVLVPSSAPALLSALLSSRLHRSSFRLPPSSVPSSARAPLSHLSKPSPLLIPVAHPTTRVPTAPRESLPGRRWQDTSFRTQVGAVPRPRLTCPSPLLALDWISSLSHCPLLRSALNRRPRFHVWG